VRETWINANETVSYFFAWIASELLHGHLLAGVLLLLL
jgi:hypothetical protein